MSATGRRRKNQALQNPIAARAVPVGAIEPLVPQGSMIVSRSAKFARTHRDAVNEFAASKVKIETGRVDNQGIPQVKMVPVMRLWTESLNRLGADTLTWCPGQPEFCDVVEKQQAGDRAYNLWVPPVMLPAPSDWQERVLPFLKHIEYLVPVEGERDRFLCWLAHIFQRPGELPHTAYLMIAKQTGIGRGTLASILTRALRGYVAANMNVDALFGGFNGRVGQKLLATVDEVREGNTINRYAKAEALKSKITEEIRSLNPKYGAQSVEKNCCRWLLFSNHPDALPFDHSDRRIIVIENPSYRADPAWYAHLHNLMADDAFIASIQQYFMTKDISAFNPHEPAPLNDAKRKALAALETDADKAAREFVESWPDELATVSDLSAFIADDKLRASSPAMRHVIERAGMTTAGRTRIDGTWQTVLIVRGHLTPADFKNVSLTGVSQKIMQARQQFGKLSVDAHLCAPCTPDSKTL